MKLLRFASSLSILFFIISCSSSNDPDVNNTQLTLANFEENIALQENTLKNAYNLLSEGKDTAFVLEDILAAMKSNTLVESASKSSKIIWVKYKNKMIGGIVLGYDETASGPLYIESTKVKDNGDETLAIPISHNALFADAHYEERADYTRPIFKKISDSLSKIGYSMKLLTNTGLDEKFDIDTMASLDRYGIVHLYSHGCAYPDKNNIKEVYVLTDSKFNIEKSKRFDKYKDDIASGDVAVMSEQILTLTKTTYAVSPGFVGKYNDFSKNRTVFYGCFCYSALGNWNKIANTYGASVYIGHTWSVDATWACTWAYDFYRYLSRYDEDKVYNVADWKSMPTHESVDKVYKNKECAAIFATDFGDDQTTLWELPEQKVVKVFGSPVINDIKLKLSPVANYGKDYKLKGEWAANKSIFPFGQYSIVIGFVKDEAKMFDQGTFDVRVAEQKDFARTFDLSVNIPKQDFTYKFLKVQITTRGYNNSNNDYFETRIYKVMIFETD